MFKSKSDELDVLVNVSDDVNLICSFCGKSRFEVSYLIMGYDAFICDECVYLCVEIIEDPTI